MDPTTESQDVFRHLILLKTPKQRPTSLDQYWLTQLALAMRNRLRVFANAPHGYYFVDDDRSECSKHEIFAFFQGDDALQALDALRQSRPTSPPVSTVPEVMKAGPPPTNPHLGRGMGRPASRPGTTSHAHIIGSSHSPKLTPPTSVNATGNPIPYFPPTGIPMDTSLRPPKLTDRNRNSLFPLTEVKSIPQNLDDCLYTMHIELEATEQDVDVAGIVYVLPIDTASSSLWFFADECWRIVITEAQDAPPMGEVPDIRSSRKRDSDADGQEDDPAVFVYDASGTLVKRSLEAWDVPIATRKPTVRRYPIEVKPPRREIQYADTGLAYLERYPFEGNEIHAVVSSWNLGDGRSVSTTLRLPRVLAYAVNDVLVSHFSHGNIGLAVPGYTLPFDPDEPSTFYEALARAENDEYIDEPTRMTIRMLHPKVVAGICPLNVSSFFYYGRYWPCAIDDGTSAEAKRVPIFTPRIPVIPSQRVQLDPDDPESTIRLFAMWTVAVEAISLLVPKVPRVNRSARIPYRDSMDAWTAITIKMPRVDAGPETDAEVPRGLPVTLDTCSAASVLPYEVVRAIATQWLGLEIPLDAGGNEKPLELYCPDELDLDDYDILFTFAGEGDSTVEFQCSASRFLKSMWFHGELGHRVPIVGQPMETKLTQDSDRKNTSPGWILGQNFFWTAFVRLDCHFRGIMPIADHANVNVRLAPQRATDAEGRYWMDETSIRFHKLSGRLGAGRLGAAGLRYED